MAKRSTKFYRKNEEEVMKALGLKPTKNSGAGWVEKEDGQNDFLIAQLKSTDADSIRIALKDIGTLEYNAATAHKVPVFVIQFLKTNDVMLLVRPTDIKQVCAYIETGECEVQEAVFDDEVFNSVDNKPLVASSPKSRQKYWEQKREEYENGKRNKIQSRR